MFEALFSTENLLFMSGGVTITPPGLNRVKVVRLSSLIPLDLRHAEQLLFLCPCSNLTVYKGAIFDHPLCASLSCLQYGI